MAYPGLPNWGYGLRADIDPLQVIGALFPEKTPWGRQMTATTKKAEAEAKYGPKQAKADIAAKQASKQRDEAYKKYLEGLPSSKENEALLGALPYLFNDPIAQQQILSRFGIMGGGVPQQATGVGGEPKVSPEALADATEKPGVGQALLGVGKTTADILAGQGQGGGDVVEMLQTPGLGLTTKEGRARVAQLLKSPDLQPYAQALTDFMTKSPISPLASMQLVGLDPEEVLERAAATPRHAAKIEKELIQGIPDTVLALLIRRLFQGGQ